MLAGLLAVIGAVLSENHQKINVMICTKKYEMSKELRCRVLASVFRDEMKIVE